MATSRKSFLDLCEKIFPILKEIKKAGGCAYAVGGSVRDLLLERMIKDLDIEVHGISLERLESVLGNFGNVDLVGKQFGVLLLYGMSIDLAIPRRDSKGRKPMVAFDDSMDFAQAARRRDVTMNAMGINLHDVAQDAVRLHALEDHQKFVTSLTIEDPYGGRQDITDGVLRAVDEQLFLEDPLRFYRVMQFVARFEMKPDVQLNRICSTMLLHDSVTKEPIAKERVCDEIKKMFLRSKQPSLGFRWIRSIGRLEELFPELHQLIDAPQRPDYHPEGDVFEHTMQALDAAASLPDYEDTKLFSATQEKLLICATTVCHDMGKPFTTTAELQARGHEEAGVPLARKFMERFCSDKRLAKMVCKLVRYHMHPLAFMKNNATPKAYKRLAKKLAPELSIRQLAFQARCDWRGRNEVGGVPFDYDDEKYHVFVQQAQAAKVFYTAEPPVLLGRHLLDEVEPGKKMGELLDKAYDIQIAENITDLDTLKQRVLKKQKH